MRVIQWISCLRHQSSSHLRPQNQPSPEWHQQHTNPRHCRCPVLLCHSHWQQTSTCSEKKIVSEQVAVELTNAKVIQLLPTVQLFLSMASPTGPQHCPCHTFWLYEPKCQQNLKSHQSPHHVVWKQSHPIAQWPHSHHIINHQHCHVFAAESELAERFICVKEIVPLHQSLIKMGWPQPQSFISNDSTSALAIANKPSLPRKWNPWAFISVGYVSDNLKDNSASTGPCQLLHQRPPHMNMNLIHLQPTD